MPWAWSSIGWAGAEPLGRALTEGELALGRSVFGRAIAWSWVRISPGGFGPFAVTLGSRLFLPPSAVRPDYALAEPAMQALFVHELVHVWQFQTRPLWTLVSWAGVVASGGYGAGLAGYRYAVPFAFARLNLEQQASVVEHAFLLRRGYRSPAAPAGAMVADYAGAPFPVAGPQGPWG